MFFSFLVEKEDQKVGFRQPLLLESDILRLTMCFIKQLTRNCQNRYKTRLTLPGRGTRPFDKTQLDFPFIVNFAFECWFPTVKNKEVSSSPWHGNWLFGLFTKQPQHRVGLQVFFLYWQKFRMLWFCEKFLDRGRLTRAPNIAILRISPPVCGHLEIFLNFLLHFRRFFW